MKPLFVPLRSEPYDQFAAGAKSAELRLYGPRWNEQTCWPGRTVILSRGYGRHHRMRTAVVAFRRMTLAELPATERRSVTRHYGEIPESTDIAVIIMDDPEPEAA